jgi:hypothetical protein
MVYNSDMDCVCASQRETGMAKDSIAFEPGMVVGAPV